MTEIKRSYCGLCQPRCGILLHIEDGKIVKVTGDPDHPVTRGAICARGRLMPDHVHHPERLNYPLKRVGEKGEGRWQKLTWDQALDEVAEKLSNLKASYGAETLAFTHGTKRTYHWDCRRFFNLFGSPNTFWRFPAARFSAQPAKSGKSSIGNILRLTTRCPRASESSNSVPTSIPLCFPRRFNRGTTRNLADRWFLHGLPSGNRTPF